MFEMRETGLDIRELESGEVELVISGQHYDANDERGLFDTISIPFEGERRHTR